MCNPFTQLANIRLTQVVVELGLAEEDYLQQFAARRFEVGQQSYFF